MAFLLFIFSLFYSSITMSCEVVFPRPFSIFISPEDESYFIYGNNVHERASSNFQINNCAKTSQQKKYIMIAFGPQNQELSDRVKIYDFTNDYRDSGCKIENSPFTSSRDFETRKIYLNEKWNLIKSCINLKLEEKGSHNLDIATGQTSCSVDELNPKVINFNGGLCFIRPKNDSDFQLSFSINKKCLNYQNLRDDGLFIQDLKSILNFYIAGDASGSSIDLTSLDSFPLRLTIAPDKEIIKPSDDLGLYSPQFPSNLQVPDIHLGYPEINIAKSLSINFKPTFWIDHRCSKKCISQNCQSICDYAQPFTGRFELNEFKDGKELPLTSWMDGAIAEPQFQGEMVASGFEINKDLLEPGRIYRLKMTLTDPKFDFEEFKSGLFSKIGRLAPFPTRNSSGTISDVPPHQTIQELNRIPAINALPALNFNYSISNAFERLVDTFSSYFTHRSWPPHFERVCNEKECREIKKNAYLILEIDFKLNEYDLKMKHYPIQVLKISRQSDLISSYERMNPEETKVTCPFKKDFN